MHTPRYWFRIALLERNDRLRALTSLSVAAVSGTKIARLGNGSIHGDRTRVVRASVGASPLPIQPVKVKPEFACALMVTFDPALRQPLAGCTVPPVPALIVRKYCVWNCRRIGLVGRRRDNVRDRSVVTPFLPDILHTGTTALR